MLVSHGMSVQTPKAAADALRQYGYYRLSGYTYWFRDPASHRFREGSRFEDVIALHRFDTALRQVVADGIAEVELALRFHVGHRLGRQHTFAHLTGTGIDDRYVDRDPDHAGPHAGWVAEYLRQEQRSQETFVLHFREKYGPRLPVWAATEIMSFGLLAALYRSMNPKDRMLIAARFGVTTSRGNGDAALMSSVIEHLRYVRNLCAHHSRLWNRTFTRFAARPSSSSMEELADQLGEPSQRTVYATLSILRYLLARISPDSGWHHRIVQFLEEKRTFPSAPLPHMGFPDDWRDRELWQDSYSPDLTVRDTVDAIDAVSCVSRPEAIMSLTSRGTEADRKKYLRYLVNHQALIELRVGEHRYYPAFQFSGGDILPLVGDINEALLTENHARTPDVGLPDRMLSAQDWWLGDIRTGTGSGQRLSLLHDHPDELRQDAHLDR